MSEIDKKFAREYALSIDRKTFFISVYDNHGNTNPDTKWSVCHWVGQGNPHYLNEKGEWNYKHGVLFDDADTAYAYLLKYHKNI